MSGTSIIAHFSMPLKQHWRCNAFDMVLASNGIQSKATIGPLAKRHSQVDRWWLTWIYLHLCFTIEF